MRIEIVGGGPGGLYLALLTKKARPDFAVRVHKQNHATDWKDGGISEGDIFAIAEAFGRAGCDFINVSAGQTVPDQRPVYGRMFQTAFAEAIRNVSRIAAMAVGNITEPGQINTMP